MRQLITALTQTVAGIGAIRMVDIDLGQLENSEAPALSFPAALVGIQQGDFVSINNLVQEAELLIGVRLAFRVFARTHTLGPGELQQEGLAHLDTLAEVNAALHGLQGNHFTGVERRSLVTEPRADLRIYRLTYSVRYRESLPDPYKKPAPENALDFCIKITPSG
jgi:hypothetical protein